MTYRADAAGLVVGGGMAAAPAMVDVPFYQSEAWLGGIAILGMLVLTGTLINTIFALRKNLKWDGRERRKNRKNN